MGRNDEIKLFDPENIDPAVPLKGDAAVQRDLHRALLAAGQEWKEKHRGRPSADFDDRLLRRLEQAEHLHVHDRDFAPVAGAGEGPFFKGKGFLAATAAIFFVAFGIFWFQAYSELRQKVVAPSLPPSPPSSMETEKAASSGSLHKDQPSASSFAPPVSRRLPSAPPPPGRPDSRDGLPMAAPAARKGEEMQKRSAWSEAPPDGTEDQLRNQIAAEKDPVRKKELLQQLLKLYEGSGQPQQAAEIRRQIQGLK